MEQSPWWELSSAGTLSKPCREIPASCGRRQGRWGWRVLGLSAIPSPWALPKPLQFVYTIVIPSTSRDRSLVIHFRGVTLIYTAWGLGLYFPKDPPTFPDEKYQSGLISRGLGYRGLRAWMCRALLPPASPGEAPGTNQFRRGAGWGLEAPGCQDLICWVSPLPVVLQLSKAVVHPAVGPGFRRFDVDYLLQFQTAPQRQPPPSA